MASCRVEYANTDNAQVYAPNGRPSILFESIASLPVSRSEAVGLYFLTEHPEFSNIFSASQTDANGEIVLTPSMSAWLMDQRGLLPSNENIQMGRSVTYADIKNRLRTVLDFQEKRYAQAREGAKAGKADKFAASIKAIRDSLDATDRLDSGLMAFINESYTYLLQTDKYISSIANDLAQNQNNPNYLTNEKIGNILKTLSNIRAFTSSFLVLKDLQAKLLTSDGADISGLQVLKDRLNAAVGLESKILSDYKNLATDVLVQWVWPLVNRTNTKLIADGDSKFVVKQKDIRDWFSGAAQDTGFFNNWLGATVASNNQLNQIMLLMVKEQLFEAHKDDLETQGELFDAYSKVSGPKDNPAEFNAKYIRDAEVWEKQPVLKDGKVEVDDATGEPKYEWVKVKRKAIHQEFYWDKAVNASHEFRQKYGDRPTDPDEARAWSKLYLNHWKENYQFRPDIDRFLKEKLESFKGTKSEKLAKLRAWVQANSDGAITMTKDQYENMLFNDPYAAGQYSLNPAVSIPWLELNPGEGFYFRPGLSSGFRTPAEKYRNREFTKLMADPYFKVLYKTYMDSNGKYPYGKRLKYGELPQVRKSGLDALKESESIGAYVNRVKSDISLGIKNREGVDVEYGGTVLQDVTGEKHHFLPTPYTHKLAYDEVSQDLLQSMMLFSQAANRYDSLAEIQPHIETASSIIFGVKDASGLTGRQLLDANKRAVKTMEEANAQLRAGLDTAYWGVTVEKAKDINLPFGKSKVLTISPNKVLSNLGFLTAANKMIFNVLSGVNNVLLGEYGTFIEAVSGKYGSLESWSKAQAYYVQHLPALMADIGKGVDRSYLSMLFDYFDVFQGNYTDQYGRQVSGSRAKNLWNMDTLFFTNNAAEHKIQATAALMKLFNTKVKTTDGKTIPMIEAYEKVGNRIRLKKNVILTSLEEKDFMNALNSMSRDINGNYATLDKAALQRKAFGELALMFRKYVYTGFRYRYGAEHLDFESGDVKEGYFRTFFKRLYMDLSTQKFVMFTDWKSIPERERANLVKAMTELLIYFGTMLAFAVMDDDDDDKKSKFQTHVMLQLRRFNADLGFFNFPVGWALNPKDILRVISTPTVAYSTITNLMDAIEYTIYEMVGSEKAKYQRKSGSNEKGDSKAVEKWKKVFPILPQIEHMENPEDILTFYKNS